MNGVEILHFDPALKEELIEFRRHTYEADFPESRDYLEWKYELNPYIKGPIYYIARAEGRIVGMRGIFGTRWEFRPGHQSVVLPCADDFAISPAYRNRGVAGMIMREAQADLARRGFIYAINTSGGRITAMASLAAGWRSATPLEPLIRRSTEEQIRHQVRTRVRKVRGLWRLVRQAGANITSSEEPFRRIDQMGRAAVRESNDSIVAEASPRVDAMANLIARLPYDGRIRHVRNAQYLTWRYRSPIRQYRFFYYERDGRVEGYLVLSRSVECQLPTLPFNVVDWEGADEAIRAELLQCAVRVARISELGTWAVSRSVRDRALLEGAGFIPTDIEQRARGLPCVLVKDLRTHPQLDWTFDGESILSPARWDMRLVYSMHG
jgi:GNAT superfamily N-acetyltransferase